MAQQTGIRNWAAARRTPILLAIVLIAVSSLFILLVWSLTRRQVTTFAVSPDGQMRAEILDKTFPSIDRNLRIRIVNADGSSRLVFVSVDEPPSGIGQERLLWSADSQRLLLVGRRFWVRKGVELTSGEALYLLHDLPSGHTWCNSDQEGPPFGPQELAGHDFGEPLTLKP